MMTVAELIEKLRELPPDLPVMLPVGYDRCGLNHVEVVYISHVEAMGHIYEHTYMFNRPVEGFRSVVLQEH